MINKKPSIKIASLNCRGLTKINRQNQQEYFISTLRSLKYDILVLQKTHAKTIKLEDTLNKKISLNIKYMDRTTLCNSITQ
jgi:exonuclease III